MKAAVSKHVPRAAATDEQHELDAQGPLSPSRVKGGAPPEGTRTTDLNETQAQDSSQPACVSHLRANRNP